jgi:hypothetical protein
VYGVFGVDSKTLRNYLMVRYCRLYWCITDTLCVLELGLIFFSNFYQAQKDRVLDDMKATMATALKESCNRVLGDYQVCGLSNTKGKSTRRIKSDSCTTIKTVLLDLQLLCAGVF